METFTATNRAALREILAAAAVLLVIAPIALFFFKGERNPFALAFFAVGTGLVTVAAYALRQAWIGRQVIQIDDEGILVRARRREERIPWAELTRAVHTADGGERWVLKRGKKAPLLVWMDGFDPEQAARIAERIRAHLSGTDPNPAVATS